MMGYSWHVNVSCDQYAFTAGFTVSSDILSHAKASFDRSFVVSLACLGMPYHDATAVYREFNVFCAAVRKTLPCMQQFPPRRRSEWGSLEWKCHVANCDKGFCTGNSCPSPGSATQDGHLQRACQRAAANMVADNWWGEEAWSGWPSPNLLKSICKSWTNKMLTLVCMCAHPLMESTWARYHLHILCVFYSTGGKSL